MLARSCFIVLLLTALAIGQELPTDAKTKLDSLLKELPSLHWYASDACLRETTRGRFDGHPQKYEDFVSENRASTEETLSVPKNGKNLPAARVRLTDPDNPKEYWIFVLVFEEGRWRVNSAHKHLGPGKANVFDLFEGDIFMGSMQPYYEKVFRAYGEAKDYKTLFPRKPAK